MLTSIEPPNNALPGDESALRTYCMWQFPVISATDKPAVKWKCKGCGSESYGSKKRARYHILKRSGEGWKICPFEWSQEVMDMIDSEDVSSKKRTTNGGGEGGDHHNGLAQQRQTVSTSINNNNNNSITNSITSAARKKIKHEFYEAAAVVNNPVVEDFVEFEDFNLVVRDASISAIEKRNKLEEKSMYYLNKRASAYNSGMTESSQLIKLLDEKILHIQYAIDKLIEECNPTDDK